VHGIRKGFQFRQQNTERSTSLEALIESKSERLLDRNCSYGSDSRADIFAGTTAVYEARVLAGGILEAEYEAQGIVDD
jgi:hypothetical protein